jgi:phytoene desaturase
MSSKNAVIVGAGFGGLATSALLARKGWRVTVIEKNDQVGGRARYWKQDGFTFDMGPSWYLMPEAFENFFQAMGEPREKYYGLTRLDPSYRVYFESSPPVDIGADFAKTRAVFDTFEADGGNKIEKHLQETAFKYRIAVDEFLYRDYNSLLDFFNRRMLADGLRLKVFRSLESYLKGIFEDHRSRKILEFPMVFLGASPSNAPALYSIMSHLDMNEGVWYPDGGMAGAALGIHRLAQEVGVELVLGSEVSAVEVEKRRARAVITRDGVRREADVVVANADYPHVEMDLLEEPWRSYPASYWRRRVLGPSMLIGYLGIRGRLDDVRHHTLYFTDDWDVHFDAIFGKAAWPAQPCYYVCCNSRTDRAAAPVDHENLFFLVPLGTGLDDSDTVRDAYFERVLEHFEGLTGHKIRDRIVVKRLYSGRDFAGDYNSYRGAALGIAHTLMQTAVFRPSLRSRKVENLYFGGQYTHPGVGVPMAVIAAGLVAEKIGEEQ